MPFLQTREYTHNRSRFLDIIYLFTLYSSTEVENVNDLSKITFIMFFEW